MSDEYEALLNRAFSQIPKISSKRDRLVIPRLQHSIIGIKTIIYNFRNITQVLNRDPQHLLKFLTKELATAATTQEQKVVFQGKFDAATFGRLLQKYMQNFVVCPICKLPDSKIVKEKRLSFLVCEACGAKSAIPQL